MHKRIYREYKKTKHHEKELVWKLLKQKYLIF